MSIPETFNLSELNSESLNFLLGILNQCELPLDLSLPLVVT